MFCPQCGNRIPEDARFCPICGKQTGSGTAGAGMPAGQEKKKTSRRRGGMVAAIAVLAVLILGAAAVLIWLLVRPSGDARPVAYVADGQYWLVNDPAGGEPAAIDRAGAYCEEEDVYRFDEEGRYLYYLTGCDEPYSPGVLHRVECRKVKADSSDNGKYIEQIAADVEPGDFKPVQDGVVYQTKYGSLRYYREGKDTVLADGSDAFEADGSGNVIFWVSNGDMYTSSALYAVHVSGKDEPRLLAAETVQVDCIFSDGTLDRVVYEELDLDHDGYGSMYAVSVDGKSELLAEKAYPLFLSDAVHDAVYFCALNGRTVSAYDLVEDRYREQDEQSTYSGQAEDYVRVDRERMRQQLLDENNGVPLRTVYCYRDGKVTTICDDVVAMNKINRGNWAVLVRQAEDLQEKPDVSELTDVSEVQSWLEQYDWNACGVITCYSQTVIRLAQEAVAPLEQYTTDWVPEIFGSQDAVWFSIYEAGLLYGDASGGEVTGFERISPLMTSGGCDSRGRVLYFDDSGAGADAYRLCLFENGGSRLVGENVMGMFADLYEDGSVAAVQAGPGQGLTLFGPDGAVYDTGAEPDRYIRTGANELLYECGGKLFYFTGEESRLLAGGVDAFCGAGKMEPVLMC